MSIQRFEPGDIEVFSIQAAPTTTYSSSSSGVTGSAYVYARRSNTIKDYYINPTNLGAPSASFVEINDLNEVLALEKLAFKNNNAAFRTYYASQYLDLARKQPQSVRNVQKQEVLRFTPGVNLDLDMTRKFAITNLLMPYYRAFGTNYDFAYTNYHSLNFFTGSDVPSNSALIYPASGSNVLGTNYSTNKYVPTGSFSFDFWINPKYTTDTTSSEFHAGTILHLSSTYALSLITGSSKDSNGYPDKYRLLLQVSSSAISTPSSINPSSLPNQAFLSNDNILERNKWQHVTVRWGTQTYNNGTGSFYVDGNNAGNFLLSTTSICQVGLTNPPNSLVVGNFLETGPGNDALFFSRLVQTRYGVPVTGSYFNSSQTIEQPSSFLLSHPLNAEIHELKIYNRYLSQDEMLSRSLSGAPLNDPSLLFYLPPLFTEESPYRTVTASLGSTNYLGGVLCHPFENINGTTRTPFNTFLSFDTGGHLINLENHTRDFATGNYPRIINLTGSVIRNNTAQLSANDFLYATGSNRKASLTVLPNDNGNFIPNYYQLLSSLSSSFFHNDNGDLAYNLVSLRNMISLDETYDLAEPASGSALLNIASDGKIISSLSGLDVTSSIGVLNYQRVPSIFQRTREPSSLQAVVFDISNLFYGNKIKPGTFVLRDIDVSNSYGKLGMTLRDDGFGSLYRADSTGSWAINNSVGNIFYDNGVVLLKNPSLYFFGKNQFECSFTGERNIHVMKADLYANPLELVSSSNPSWNPSLKASNNLDDPDKRYVYITDLYLHDDNLNVIARTKLASPVLKKTSEKLVFHVKLDF